LIFENPSDRAYVGNARSGPCTSKDIAVEDKELARQLRRIATQLRDLATSYAPADAIVREIRAVADRLHPPIETSSRAKTVTRYVEGRRVSVKTQPRKSFQIFVGK